MFFSIELMDYFAAVYEGGRISFSGADDTLALGFWLCRNIKAVGMADGGDHPSVTPFANAIFSKIRTGGASPRKRSTSTLVIWPVEPCASFEVPISRVRMFGLP